MEISTGENRGMDVRAARGAPGEGRGMNFKVAEGALGGGGGGGNVSGSIGAQACCPVVSAHRSLDP